MARKPRFFAVRCEGRPLCVAQYYYVDYGPGGFPGYSDPDTGTTYTLYTQEQIIVYVNAGDVFTGAGTGTLPVTLYFFDKPADLGNSTYGLRVFNADSSPSFDFRQSALKLIDVKSGSNYQSGVATGSYGSGTYAVMNFIPSGRMEYNSGTGGFDSWTLFSQVTDAGAFSASEIFTGTSGSYKGGAPLGTSYSQLTYSVGVANVAGL